MAVPSGDQRDFDFADILTFKSLIFLMVLISVEDHLKARRILNLRIQVFLNGIRYSEAMQQIISSLKE